MRRRLAGRARAGLLAGALALGLVACEEESPPPGYAVPPPRSAPEGAGETGGEVESGEGRFSFTLPADLPRPAEQREELREAGVELVSLRSEAPSGDRGLKLSWCDYPPSVFAAVPDPFLVLDAGRAGALELMGAVVVREEVRPGDHPVRSTWFRADLGDGAIHGRIDEHARPPRVYQLRVIAADPAALEDPQVLGAFESFRCWEGPAPTVALEPVKAALPPGYPQPVAEEALLETSAGPLRLQRRGAGGALGTFWLARGEWLEEGEAEPQARLEAALAGVLALHRAQAEGPPRSRRLGPWPGHEVTFSGPRAAGEGRVHGRLAQYLVGGRLVQLLFVSPVPRAEDPAVEAVFQLELP